MLRNPVDRAYSHYRHEVRIGLETLSFEEAIKKEEERLYGECERMLADENWHSRNHQEYSYLTRGIYINQLRIWMNLFPIENILIIRSKDFYSNPSLVVRDILKFLNLENTELMDYNTKYQEGNYPPMNPDTRKELIEYFKPYNKNLYEYLGINYGWDK